MTLSEKVAKSYKVITLKSGGRAVCSSECWGQIFGSQEVVLIRVEEDLTPEKVQVHIHLRSRGGKEIKVDSIILRLRDKESNQVWFSKEYPFYPIHLHSQDEFTITIELCEE